MYNPPAFEESRLPILHEAIRATRLATLVTFGAEGIIASHLPIILDAADGPFGSIRGHLARANPQWREITPEVPALAIFPGPDAYISPSWYATKQQSGKVVPTWNYVAVHAYGTIEFFDDPDQLRAIVTDLTLLHEEARPDPWAVTDAPPEFIRAQLKGIVGFRLPIARLEGKWKLSQNRSDEDRAGVICGLKELGRPAETAIADPMAKNRPTN